MKRICLALYFSLLVMSNVFAQWEAVGAKLLGDALNEFGDKINNAVDRAGTNGNYLVENAGNKANLLLQNVHYLLDKQLDKRVRQLSDENQKLVRTLYDVSQSLDNAVGGILQLEDFLVLDIQNLVDQLPFKQDVYLLRSIKGYSINYRDRGFYTVTLTGNAFGPDAQPEVFVDGSKIDPNSFKKARAHTLEFDIPFDVLKSKFYEDKRVCFKTTRSKIEAEYPSGEGSGTCRKGTYTTHFKVRFY